jgi:hypothetical protein
VGLPAGEELPAGGRVGERGREEEMARVGGKKKKKKEGGSAGQLWATRHPLHW